MDKQSNKGRAGKPSAVELAILNGIEAYERNSKGRTNGQLRSKEAMSEAGYTKKRVSRAKGKGTKIPSAFSENKHEPDLRREKRAPQNGEIQRKKHKKQPPVRVLFFGGVGEIGKNMTAIEYGNDIILIDAGIIFPTEEMPGIDLVFPDISYLVQRKNKIRGVFLTHGHEDHIGGVPYLMKEISAPVYGTKLTLALVDNKLREHKLNNIEEHTVSAKDKVKAGVFTVNFVNVNHSIAGALALAIETPYGIIFHSGDFKIDLTPVAGAPIDLSEIAE